MTTLAKKQIKNLLLEHLQKNKADLAEFNALILAAEANKGQINKRIEKHLPDGCSYYVQYGMYYVKFPSGNEHLIGWVGSTSELTSESLRRSDSCHSNGAEDRISRIETILKDGNFELFCAKFIKLQKAVKSVVSTMDEIKNSICDSYYNPAYYPLLKICGISQTAWFELDDIRAGRK